MSRSAKAHLLLLAVVAIWGSTFVLVKDALANVSPLLFNLMRMALAALCVGIFYRKHIGHIDRLAVLYGSVTGLFLATGYQFQTAGLRLTTPSKSAFITGMTVIFVPLLVAIPRLRPWARGRRGGMPSWAPCSPLQALFFLLLRRVQVFISVQLISATCLRSPAPSDSPSTFWRSRIFPPECGSSSWRFYR